MTDITTETSSKRNLTVLAVVVACFAVLWPKIFYPMIISILFPSDEEENQDEIRKLDFHNMLHPQMREAMGEARPLDKPLKDVNKALFHPSVRHTVKPQSKGAGAVNLVIPMYTIAIILFFIYSLLKTLLKKNQETCHVFVNPNQQKPVCIHKCNETEDKRKENTQERKAQRALEQYGKHKVLTALKTIILEMEEFKGNLNETPSKHDAIFNSEGKIIHYKRMTIFKLSKDPYLRFPAFIFSTLKSWSPSCKKDEAEIIILKHSDSHILFCKVLQYKKNTEFVYCSYLD